MHLLSDLAMFMFCTIIQKKMEIIKFDKRIILCEKLLSIICEIVESL
jgi:hypothetical protein